MEVVAECEAERLLEHGHGDGNVGDQYNDLRIRHVVDQVGDSLARVGGVRHGEGATSVGVADAGDRGVEQERLGVDDVPLPAARAQVLGDGATVGRRRHGGERRLRVVDAIYAYPTAPRDERVGLIRAGGVDDDADALFRRGDGGADLADAEARPDAVAKRFGGDREVIDVEFERDVAGADQMKVAAREQEDRGGEARESNEARSATKRQATQQAQD